MQVYDVLIICGFQTLKKHQSEHCLAWGDCSFISIKKEVGQRETCELAPFAWRAVTKPSKTSPGLSSTRFGSQVDVLENVDAVDWLLLTSEPIQTVTQAQKVVRLYCLRWLVEEYNKYCKSDNAHRRFAHADAGCPDLCGSDVYVRCGDICGFVPSSLR